jgi:hypothetical protein
VWNFTARGAPTIKKNSLGYTIYKAGLCFGSSFHAALDPFCNGIRSHHGGNETDNNILDEAKR